ncbi:MAG: hypothetical protein JRG96_14320, partial [Deltaproteobacteria bacterium]|nr:hypothetical protein [Deltaproteobacteria bacterium]
FSVFEMLRAAMGGVNPKFAHTLDGTIADERRHVGFGENRIGSLIRQFPEKKPEVEKMQQEMSYHMLATFSTLFATAGVAMEEGRRLSQQAADAGEAVASAEWQGRDVNALSPEEMEGVLSDTVLKEFKLRLGRVGIEYQTPSAP